MSNASEVTFLGRLGKNPELKYSKDQKPVCYLSVAEKVKDTQATHWHQVIVFGKQAEACSIYLKKGSIVFVNGKAELKDYINIQGVKKEFTEIRANNVGFSSL
mgnify:CR=1 FL=1